MRLIPLAAVLLCGCNSWFFQPSRRVFETPDGLGLKTEDVRFPSADGTVLAGLFIHAASGPAKGTVVHFHGNAENLTSHFAYSHWLAAYGYHVFIFDYRGYGASAGEAGLEGAIEDGVAAIAYASRRPEADPRKVAVWGQSLGGAIAAASVARSTAVAVAALILESSFPSYRAIARDVLSRAWLTWPVQWLAFALVSDRHGPARFLRGPVRCPVLVVHGDADKVVPLRLGRALFAATQDPKEFWLIEGGGHLGAFQRQPENRPRLDAFLQAALGRPH